MEVNSNETTQKIVKMVQELLLEEMGRTPITPALIAAKIEIVAALNARWRAEMNVEAVTDELVRRFSIRIGEDTTMKNEAGHIAWLGADRKRDWRYWQRYREWLERKLSYLAVDALDRATDSILALLEDPNRDGRWDRRGLVVGHVQSGKTGNYTGLICKAADAGYKIIIVLAGLHNNLRSQTQVRLEEGFLGYETKATPEDLRLIGVGEIDSDISIRPNHVTNRSETGDFVTAAARNLGITPEQRPWLFVIKKNKTVLERLHTWIRNHVTDHEDPQTGRKIVTRLPLLVIDDEADNASVDTGEQSFDASGRPDEDHDPTAINSRIRKILHSFARAAYVGYTATPFANIFIHDRGATTEEGPDLFPSGFIINLAAPSNYVGPVQVFGTPSADGRANGLPLVRTIEDADDADGRSVWMPSKHKNGHVPLHDGKDEIPPSLIEAIDAFVLACATRRARGHGAEHCSMLVHVTRFTAVQAHVHRQIDAQLRQMKQRLLRRIDHLPTLDRLHSLWKNDFIETTCEVLERYPQSVAPVMTWDLIEAELSSAIEDIEIRSINGTVKDALDYTEQAGRGLKVIAVGGDKLARGLTLEGLTVSYFLRASRMYDTLMQMGRWFGYRPGYLDLCRLYTTEELIEWFGHIADASEELREEFDVMADSGATPKEYGLRVQSHPVLLVTSRLKMRAARDLWLSFSGQILETTALYKDPTTLSANFIAAQTLVGRLGYPKDDGTITRIRNGREAGWKGSLWQGVKAVHVVEFLLAYRTHPAAHKVKSDLVAEFIQSMNESGELIDWTIAVIGGGDGDQCDMGGGTSVSMLKRKSEASLERYSIGRLISPRDEAIDLDETAWMDALQATQKSWRADPARSASAEAKEPEDPSGPYIRKVRGLGGESTSPAPERGLLLLYALDPLLADAGFPAGTPPVIAFAASFPASNTGRKVKYTVNTVQLNQWEAEYGTAG